MKAHTLAKYKSYAKKNGLKLWRVFDDAIEHLTKGDE